jgi:LPS export ABC transporter protein LptC
MKSGKLWVVLIGAAALVAAWFLGRGGSAPGTAAGDADSAQTSYGYEAQDVIVRQTGVDGSLSYKLTADHVAQLPPDGRIVADKLTMNYRPESQTGPHLAARDWTLTADSARLPEDGSLLHLQGNVVAVATSQKSADPLVLRSPELDYDTRKQTVSTKSPVQFRWGSQQMSALGMQANIKLGTVELESQVNGRITP